MADCPSTSWIPRYLRPTAWLLICAAGLIPAARARGQSLWEVSPYRIEVWVAVASHPQVDLTWVKQLPGRVEQLGANQLGAVWQLQVRTVPNEFRGLLLQRAEIDPLELRTQYPPATQLDKVMCVVVDRQTGGYRISVGEVELTLYRPPAWRHATTSDVGQLPRDILELICAQFTALVQIERIYEGQVQASVRGGALQRPESSPRHWTVPTEIRVDDVLRPVILRADRRGQVGPEGVKPIDWTVLKVTSRTAGKVICDVESGYRQPFVTRRSSRIQQVAYRVTPRHESSTLRLVDRRDPNRSLVGYEVYRRLGRAAEKTELLGRTDFQGELSLQRDPQHPVQVLFIRSGQQLLAKLPVVPGDEPLLVAPLRNDDLRLEAEGFLQGIQDNLVDLVARREVLALRIRRAIDAGELDQADQLLRELRQLDTADDFVRRVERRKQSLSTMDAQVQQRIDELFAQTRSLLGKFLGQEQVDELSRLLASAREAGDGT